MWTLITMALAALLWLVFITMGHNSIEPINDHVLAVVRLIAIGLSTLVATQVLQRLLSLALLRKGTQQNPVLSDLARSAMNMAMYAVSAVLFLRFGLGQDITSVLATSAVVTVILGMALQPTLGHFFSGVSIEIDRPLRAGDCVRRSDVEGRVVSLSWRSVSLETAQGTTLVMPNAEFTSRSVEIIRANRPSRHQVDFHMDSQQPPSQVIQLAMGVLRSGLANVCQTPAPTVVVLGVDPATGTVRYGARFYTLHFLIRSTTASLFLERLWYALSRKGWALPESFLSWSSAAADPMDGRQPNEEEQAQLLHPLYSMRRQAAPALANRYTTDQAAHLANALAALPAPLRTALQATARTVLYGPGELCDTKLAGLVLKGVLREDRKPEPEQHAAALEALRDRLGQAPSGTSLLDQNSLDTFVRMASLAMGPAARNLCLRIAELTDDIGLAYEVLAESILDAERRKTFTELAPQRLQTRITAGSWFGWAGMLQLDAHPHECRAVQECALLVWPAQAVHAALHQLPQQAQEEFAELLRAQSPGCRTLSLAHLTSWASGQSLHY